MPGTVVIPARFCGPPDRGNGGMTAGLLAAHVEGPAQVTLRRPAPLDTPMVVDADADGAALSLRHGEIVIAEAVGATVDVEPPPPVTMAEARRAAANSPMVAHPEWHPFPTCFVCGPGRRAGDGLRVQPGRVGSCELFAAPISYPADLAGDDGRIPPELMWAGLDCPSSFVMYMDGEPPPSPYVLGRIAARIDRRPRIDATLIALSWPLGSEGRKLFAASALYDRNDLVAIARATWISV